MILFEDIKKLFSLQLKGNSCIEIEFLIEGSSKYDSCWMGKTPDKENARDVYWYGLVSDGSEAYDYDNFRDLSAAPVFDGKSLEEIWEKVKVLSIDGCEPESRIATYF